MALEIERKFLIDDWPRLSGPGWFIRQGYLQTDPGRSVRVRIIKDPEGEQAFLTVKGGGPSGRFTRLEYEYVIPVADAEGLMALCEGVTVEKYRHEYLWQGRVWELDRFTGRNEGLLLAEVELENEQEDVKPPLFISVEVTDDPRYFNLALAQYPFMEW